MKYQITIKKTDRNENFAVEMAAYNEKNKYRNNYGMDREQNYPQEYTITDALICELTDEQFKKVKAEAFKVFE